MIFTPETNVLLYGWMGLIMMFNTIFPDRRSGWKLLCYLMKCNFTILSSRLHSVNMEDVAGLEDAHLICNFSIIFSREQCILSQIRKINWVSFSQVTSFKIGEYNLPSIDMLQFTNRVKWNFWKIYFPHKHCKYSANPSRWGRKLLSGQLFQP